MAARETSSRSSHWKIERLFLKIISNFIKKYVTKQGSIRKEGITTSIFFYKL